MARRGQDGSRRRDKEGVRWGGGRRRQHIRDVGWGRGQGRQRNGKKGINQHRFHCSKCGEGRPVHIKGTPLPASASGPRPRLIFPTHWPSQLSPNPGPRAFHSLATLQTQTAWVPAPSGVGLALQPSCCSRQDAVLTWCRRGDHTAGLLLSGGPSPAPGLSSALASGFPLPLFPRSRIAEPHFQMET